MNGIDPASPVNRPVPSMEAGAGKIAEGDAATDESTAQQNGSPQTPAQTAPEQALGRRGHSDPAVSLSASLAKIGLGATLNATVVGFDSSSQPIIKTDQGTFILDVSGVKPPLNLKLDSQIELRVAAIDHVIEAELVVKDAVKINPPVRLALTLVMLDAGPGLKTGPANALLAANLPASGLADHYGPALGQAFVQGAGQGLSAQTSGQVLANVNPLLSGLNIETARASAVVTAGTPTPAATSANTLPPLPGLMGNQLAALQSEAPTSAPMASATAMNTGDALLKGLVLSGAFEAAPVTNGTPTAAVQVLVKIIDVIRPGNQLAVIVAGGALPVPAETTAAALVGRTAGQPLVTASGSHGIEAVVIEAAISPLSPSRDTGPGSVSNMLQLSTSAGLIRVSSPVDIPAGVRLVVELAPQAGAASPTPDAQPQLTPTGLNAASGTATLARYLEHWTVLDEIVQALAIANPLLAARIQANLSAPLQNMSNAAMFLASAMGLTKGAERWLGRDVVDALVRAGKQSLIARLDDDFQHISKLGRESAPADWKPAMLPFHDGRETQALPVMIRHFISDRPDDHASRGGDDRKASGEKVTRFVIDLSMSRMGSVQMDGMIKARSFSLIMRTEQPLAAGMRDEIRAIFGAALTRNRFEGDLDFQPGKPFPLSAAAPFMGHGGTPENVYA